MAKKQDKGKNIGEWGELYAFFKILSEKRIYTADANYNRTNVFLNVLSLIREEVAGFVYRYCTGDTVVIKLNNKIVATIPNEEFVNITEQIWKMLDDKQNTTFSDEEVQEFLHNVFITKITSPAQKKSDYFGGTIDIMVETQDKSGVVRELGFSCKTEISSASTLFNASGDATNFLYELEGDFNDDMMNHFNGLFNKVVRKGEEKLDFATRERMAYLNDNGINLKFVRPFNQTTAQNLVMCGGLEMPDIVGEMLKKFYYKNLGSRVSILDCIDDLAETDVVGYGFSNLHDLYYGKVATLLYSMFTGLKMGKPWNGRAEVNGGYVVVKSDGDVVAYHSTVTDEFKDFLVHKLHMEAPSHKRHKDMVIEKIDGKYYLKLALQLRFSMKK